MSLLITHMSVSDQGGTSPTKKSLFLRLLVKGLEHKPRRKNRYCIFRILCVEEPDLLFEEKAELLSGYAIKRRRYVLRQLKVICTNRRDWSIRLGFYDDVDTPRMIYECLNFQSYRAVNTFAKFFVHWIEKNHHCRPQILDYF